MYMYLVVFYFRARLAAAFRMTPMIFGSYYYYYCCCCYYYYYYYYYYII